MSDPNSNFPWDQLVAPERPKPQEYLTLHDQQRQELLRRFPDAGKGIEWSKLRCECPGCAKERAERVNPQMPLRRALGIPNPMVVRLVCPTCGLEWDHRQELATIQVVACLNSRCSQKVLVDVSMEGRVRTMRRPPDQIKARLQCGACQEEWTTRFVLADAVVVQCPECGATSLTAINRDGLVELTVLASSVAAGVRPPVIVNWQIEEAPSAPPPRRTDPSRFFPEGANPWSVPDSPNKADLSRIFSDRPKQAPEPKPTLRPERQFE